MKRTILLLLTLSLILGVFLSCSHKTVDPIDDQTSSSPSEDTSAESTENVIDDSTESNETNQSENTETDDRLTEITTETQENLYPTEYNYTVKKIDGQWYMIWDHYWDGGFSDSSIHYESVYVDSIDALKNGIPNGDLGQDASIFFMKYVNANTYTSIPLYDIDHVWQPTLPDGFPAVYTDMIALRPGSYSFQAWYVEHPEWLGISGPAYTIEVLSKESYESSYEYADQSLTSYGWSKKELRDGDKVLTVYSSSGESAHEEGTFLYSYRIYATNGQYYGTIDTTLDHELTDEELLGFGFKEYLR